MNRTFLQQKITKTTDFDGTSIDVSALIDDWTLFLQVFSSNLTNASGMRFTFQSSTDGGVTFLDGPTVAVVGSAGSGPRRFAFEKRDFPNLLIGIANATLRVSTRGLTGNGSVVYSSWIENGA